MPDRFNSSDYPADATAVVTTWLCGLGLVLVASGCTSDLGILADAPGDAGRSIAVASGATNQRTPLVDSGSDTTPEAEGPSSASEGVPSSADAGGPFDASLQDPSDASTVPGPPEADADSGVSPSLDAGLLSDGGVGQEPTIDPIVERLVLTSTSPSNGALGVGADSNIVLRFSAPIQLGAGTLSVRRMIDGSIVEESALDDDRITVSLASLVFDPDKILPAGEDLYVTVSADALVASGVEPFAGLSDPSSYAFRTAPLDLPVASEPVLWLDASHPSSFKVENDRVAVWADRSGAGHVLRAVEARRPARGTTFLNNLSVVEFKEVAPLSLSTLTQDELGTFDLFIVLRGKAATGSVSQRVLDWNPLLGVNWGAEPDGPSRAALLASASGGGNVIVPFGTPSTGQAYLWNCRLGDGTLDTLTDGSLVASVASASLDVSPDPDAIFFLGGQSNGSNLFNGDVAEVMLFRGKLDASDHTALTAQLKNKWGIP